MAEAVPDRDRADNPDCRAHPMQKSASSLQGPQARRLAGWPGAVDALWFVPRVSSLWT